MSREKSLVRNTLLYTVGNFTPKVMSFLLLPLYTAYLSTSDYGYFDLILSSIAFLLPLISFQLSDGMYRHLLDCKGKLEQSTVISNTLLITVRNLCIANIIYIVLMNFIEIRHSILIGVLLNSSIIWTIISQIARGLRLNHLYVIGGLVNAVVNLMTCMILVMLLGFKVEGLLIANISTNLISLLFLIIKMRLFTYIQSNLRDKVLQKQLIAYSLPLIPNMMNWWIMNVSDRYLLSYYLNTDAVGIYSVANKLPSIIILLSSVFYLAWQETAISEFKSADRDRFYTNMFNHFMKFQIACLLLLIAFTPYISKLLIHDSFMDAINYMPLLYIASVFSSFSSFYGTGFQSAKETKGAFYSSIAGSIVNLLVNILLIPIIGIQAASISTMLAFMSMWIIRIYQTKKYFSIKLKVSELLMYALLVIITVGVFYTKVLYLNIVLMFACMLLSIYLNKTLLIKMKSTILQKRKKATIGV